jgi:tRNA threonylcarbamoyladenosine biosynthesis protein TsaB
MKILAIDSSGLTASVALSEDGVMMAEYTVTHKKTHSQTLLPMLDTVVTMLQLDLQEIDAIAVAKGPGSFTGLRIGSSTAKGLAFVLDKPIIPVPTVDAIAYNLYGTQALICPLMDARRNQTYTGVYTFEQKETTSEFLVLSEQKAVAIEEILEELNTLARKENKNVIFLGDGVDVFKKQIEELVKVPYSFAPPHLLRQRAGAVGALGSLYYQKGIFEPAAAHVPEYLRLSQAEREREKKLCKTAP